MSRLFRGPVRPVEIGKKLVRAMDDHRSIGVSGQAVVPNAFRVEMSAEDLHELEEIQLAVQRELADAARAHARAEDYAFMGPVTVELVAGDRRPGRFAIDAAMVAAEGGAPTGALVLPTGERVLLGEYVVSIGRLPECTITLADTNASRVHAEIHPRGDGYVAIDQGSTNGTLVNGQRMSEHRLRDGDELQFGNTTIRFEAS